MTYRQNIEALQRIDVWQDAARKRLLDDMRARGACNPVPLTLHNWGRCGGQEPYKTLDREFRFREGAIFDRSRRLSEHFHRQAIAEVRAGRSTA